MKNRYDNILRKYNQEIIDLAASNPLLFEIAAKEIQKLYKKGNKIIEIGAGEGNSALPILKDRRIKLDLLDISKEMLQVAKKKLKAYKNRTKYICMDAYAFLKTSKPYNIIFASWTIHNFEKSDREKMLQIVFSNLTKGGRFILMDKVYPVNNGKELLAIQNNRYQRYLPKNVAKAIIAHEKEDASDQFRIDQEPFIKLLREIGFTRIDIVDRIEREIVLIAKK